MVARKGRICCLMAVIGAAQAFAPLQLPTIHQAGPVTALSANKNAQDNDIEHHTRRGFLTTSTTAVASASMLLSQRPAPASAKVFLDPAMYGDQENRVAAVDTLRERVRRAILQDPPLATAFYQLALLDGLTYNQATTEGGPDGSIMKLVFTAKETDVYTQRLQKAATTLLESASALKRFSAITVADSIAIGGAEAVNSIGGPVLAVQLGRTDAAKSAKPPSNVSLNLLSGKASPAEVGQAFKKAGLTEREMTCLLGALLTVQTVQAEVDPKDYTQAERPKYRERGKIGRMSEFKRLTDEDLARMEDEYDEDPDDGWYIADSFGTREQAFGERIGKEQINEKTFNKYLQALTGGGKKAAPVEVKDQFGWVATILLDDSSPTVQSWLNKYASSNLSYLKDLGVAFNAITQLGAEYTGGKYESLLKDRKRKSLNDDDLKF